MALGMLGEFKGMPVVEDSKRHEKNPLFILWNARVVYSV